MWPFNKKELQIKPVKDLLSDREAVNKARHELSEGVKKIKHNSYKLRRELAEQSLILIRERL